MEPVSQSFWDTLPGLPPSLERWPSSKKHQPAAVDFLDHLHNWARQNQVSYCRVGNFSEGLPVAEMKAFVEMLLRQCQGTGPPGDMGQEHVPLAEEPLCVREVIKPSSDESAALSSKPPQALVHFKINQHGLHCIVFDIRERAATIFGHTGLMAETVEPFLSQKPHVHVEVPYLSPTGTATIQQLLSGKIFSMDSQSTGSNLHATLTSNRQVALFFEALEDSLFTGGQDFGRQFFGGELLAEWNAYRLARIQRAAGPSFAATQNLKSIKIRIEYAFIAGFPIITRICYQLPGVKPCW